MSVADSSSIAVFAPGLDLHVPPDCRQIETPGDLAGALRDPQGLAAMVVWGPAIPESAVERMADAIRASGIQCIEVRPERWDGRTPSPLSAACRGVISGFGIAGILAALDFLRAELRRP